MVNKYCTIIAHLFTFIACTVSSSAQGQEFRYEQSIVNYERQTAENPLPENCTMFVGSSTWRLWGAQLEEDFAEFNAVNRGFGGATNTDVLHVMHRIITPHKPARIMFFCGGNDIARGASSDETFENFRVFLSRLHVESPHTDVFFVSITGAPSRAATREQTLHYNALVKEYAEKTPKLHYIDITASVAGEDGRADERYFLTDRLHLNRDGQKQWIPIITKALREAIDMAAAQPAPTVIVNADFENGMPSGINAYSVTTAIDTSLAHSGRASLRITSVPTVSAGTFTFNLDGRIDFSANAEFSLWIYAEPDTNPAVYVSANDGTRRYLIASATPINLGQWTRVSGRVCASDWRSEDKDFKLVIRTSGTCWIDDVLMSTGTSATPSQVWHNLKQQLHAAADKRASTLALGATLTLDARNAALAPDTAFVQTILPDTPDATIPAEGLLVFAIDAEDDLELTGALHLEPDDDLRPAIRVTVLCNDTVIGAPSVKAAPWEHWANGRPGSMPNGIRGERPPSIVELAGFRMTKGRHYITIAGPHIRSGGIVEKLELRAKASPAEKPLYTFGMFADTHFGHGRAMWANTKLLGHAGGEFEVAVRQLKRENAEFAIIAGDMTDHAWLKEIEIFASAVERGDLPVYGCYGNHDTFDLTARTNYASLVPKLFPFGHENTDYAFTRPPLRFIVLDGGYWRDEDGKLHEQRVPNAVPAYRDDITDWLRETLAEDTITPTIVISHFLFYIKGGVSDITGYNGEDTRMDKEIMPVLDAAPNVVATFSGHHHYNAFATHNGITCIMIPSFTEWPNAYHVCRIYPDRLEWEIRQFSNRGIIREGVIVEKALLYTLHTTEGDLSGTIPLVPRKP